MITNEHLVDIDRAFDEELLVEIFGQYARCGRKPSEAVCEAFAHVYGRTLGEVAEEFELYAANRRKAEQSEPVG